MVLGKYSVSSPRQGLSGLVDPGHPAGGGHDPLPVMDAAGVRLVDDLAAADEPLTGGAVDDGGLHLPEIGGYDSEHHHKFRHLFPGGQTQGRGRGVQYIVLLGAEVVRQYPPGTVAVGGLVDDLVAAGDIPGAGLSNRRTPMRRWSYWRCP